MKQFILRIEGNGECLQGAHWAWISSVKGFDERKKCQAYFKGRKVLQGFDMKAKVGEDLALEADSAQMPINPKIRAHKGEVPHYLCIDSSGKDYLHLGFIYAEGSEICGDFLGQKIIIKNAKNLDFDFSENSAIGNAVREKYADLNAPDSPPKQNAAITGLARIFTARECGISWWGNSADSCKIAEIRGKLHFGDSRESKP